MSLTDDIVKFCKDLVLGDFEDEPGNAAMVIGGLISLIPIVDQIMDVRDVAGMIYRINKKGTANCTKDDWVDLAMAAFGCIPEVGSLFKTMVKPLWKGRAALRGAMRGAAFIESMLGKVKGRAVTFIRAFDWAGNTQAAIQQALDAADLCDQFLGELSTPHWWLPDEVEGLARDLRPGLQQVKGTLRTGIEQGSAALREFVVELLGEDGYRVAQLAAGAAGTASHPRPNSRTPEPTRRRPASREQAPHAPIADTHVRDRTPSQGPVARATRLTRGLLSEIGVRFKGLIGEHMAHYHHMHMVADGGWPHGVVGGPNAAWSTRPRLVTERGQDWTPTELVPEHLPRVNQNGLDGVWQLSETVYHFVEAKFSESAGALFGRGHQDTTSGTRRDGTTYEARKLEPPPRLTERQLALWFMLGQPNRGLQMGVEWLRSHTTAAMSTVGNLPNRFVYAIFAVPSSSPPKDYTVAPGGPLRKVVAPGVLQHIAVSSEVALRMVDGGDVHEIALHDRHKSVHGLSDEFGHADIDALERSYIARGGRAARRRTPPAAPAPNRRTTSR